MHGSYPLVLITIKAGKGWGKKAISRWEVSGIKTKIKTEFNMAWAFLKMLN